VIAQPWWGAELLARGAAKAVWVQAYTAVTRAEASRRVAEFAQLFAERGVRPHMTVALQISPSYTYLWALLGLWHQGAQVMLLDHRLQQAEAQRLLDLCEPQYHVHSGDAGRLMTPFGEERQITVQARRTGLPARTEHCLLQFSSGSTGRPKVIGRTADSLLEEVDRFAAIEHMPGSGERILLLNSMVHSFGLVAGVLHSLNVGATLVIPPRLRAHDLLRTAAEAGVDTIFGVPLHFDLLSQVNDPPPLPALRLAVSCGEKLSAEVFERFEQRYGLRIGQGYGMTEVGIIATDLAGHLPPPSVGWPAPGIEAKVEGEELYVRLDRSPYVHADKTGRYANGWLRTFDLADQDPRTGALRIRGRADSMVVIGGLNVDLTEVEAVLRTHEQVSEAVVVYGDVIEAHVAVTSPLSVDLLVAWCRERLSAYKLPKQFHVVPTLPRTTTGKLIRNRDLLHASYAGPGAVQGARA
jgi:3-hydroxy-4-methylanthranilate adenylyltransferase